MAVERGRRRTTGRGTRMRGGTTPVPLTPARGSRGAAATRRPVRSRGALRVGGPAGGGRRMRDPSSVLAGRGSVRPSRRSAKTRASRKRSQAALAAGGYGYFDVETGARVYPGRDGKVPGLDTVPPQTIRAPLDEEGKAVLEAGDEMGGYLGAEGMAPSGQEFSQDFNDWLQQELDAVMSEQYAGAVGVPEGYYPEGMGEQWRPIYFEEDILAPAGRSPEAIRAIQVDLVRAGLLTDTFSYGVWDELTSDAYGAVLGYANQMGTGSGRESKDTAWRVALERLRSARPDPVEHFNRTYVRPDIASMRAAVRDVFEQRLGRRPSAEVLEQYAQEMGDMEQASAQEQFLSEVGTGAERQLGMQPGGFDGSVDDPDARFEEMFLQKYGKEIEMGEQAEAQQKSASTLTSGAGLLRNMIGGLR